MNIFIIPVVHEELGKKEKALIKILPLIDNCLEVCKR